eukprot:5985715-Alexandrium_andersonii.AAC.1
MFSEAVPLSRSSEEDLGDSPLGCGSSRLLPVALKPPSRATPGQADGATTSGARGRHHQSLRRSPR